MSKVSRLNKKNRNNSKKKNKNIHLLESLNLNNIRLGDIEAEKDDNLSCYFLDSPIYYEVMDLEYPTCILIGEKGTGKSAILKKISIEEHPDDVIYMSNNDLSVLAMQTQLKEFLSNDDFREKKLAFKFLWQFIICAQVLQHYFNQKNWFDKLKTSMVDDKFKKLNDFFKITKNDTPLKFSLTAATKILDPNAPIEYSLKSEISKEELKEIHYLENLMREMNDFIKNIDDYITSDKLYLFIDDLDSTWNNSDFAKLYTEGLIQAVYTINRKSKLKVVITLLESVFNSIELHNKDKIDGNYAKNIKWDSSRCEKMIMKRLEYYKINFNNIFTKEVSFDDIYKYTTGTPRDIIKFFQQCLDIYNEKRTKINKEGLKIIIDSFSNLKLQELITYTKKYHKLDIVPVIEGLKGDKKMYNYKSLSDKLNSILEVYTGIEVNDYRLKNLIASFNGQNIKSLIEFLYKIGFIGFSNHSSIKTGCYVNENPSHDINEKFHYIIRPIYVSKMSIK